MGRLDDSRKSANATGYEPRLRVPVNGELRTGAEDPLSLGPRANALPSAWSNRRRRIAAHWALEYLDRMNRRSACCCGLFQRNSPGISIRGDHATPGQFAGVS